MKLACIFFFFEREKKIKVGRTDRGRAGQRAKKGARAEEPFKIQKFQKKTKKKGRHEKIFIKRAFGCGTTTTIRNKKSL